MATIVMASFVAAASCLVADNPPAENNAAAAHPEELGTVHWLRGFDDAAKLARSGHKPLLVLFQEVPGCSTCVNYGNQVLSHPLMVEAAETLFVPVAVYNNIKGADETTLKSFEEKAWNNPVVRIVMPDRTALAPRVADDYTVAGLAHAMVTALAKTNRDVPSYLQLLAEESIARKHPLEKATFAMHCFWEGEAALGRRRGVYSTMPGFLNDLEVVELEYDPKAISFEQLLSRAKAESCASTVFARSAAQQQAAGKVLGDQVVRTDDAIRPDKQPKYYLSNTPLKNVPMTQLQACRINSAIGRKTDPRGFLSPRQIQLLSIVERHPKALWPMAAGATDLAAAWKHAQAVVRSVEHGRTSGSGS